MRVSHLWNFWLFFFRKKKINKKCVSKETKKTEVECKRNSWGKNCDVFNWCQNSNLTCETIGHCFYGAFTILGLLFARGQVWGPSITQFVRAWRRKFYSSRRKQIVKVIFLENKCHAIHMASFEGYEPLLQLFHDYLCFSKTAFSSTLATGAKLVNAKPFSQNKCNFLD